MEERDNDFHEIRATIDAVLQEILAMVVTSRVPRDPPGAEERMKIFETGEARGALRDSKAMTYLIAGLVAASAGPA